MKVRDLVKTMAFAALVVLTLRPGAAFCFQDTDNIEKGSITIGSGIVAIDSINIEPEVSSPTGIVSIDSISYQEADNAKGEIRIARSEELVNLTPQTPKANEAADKAASHKVEGSAEEALGPGLPGQARSTAILDAPTYIPSYNRLGGTVSPIQFNNLIILHHSMISTAPAMASAGIGTTMMVCGPPSNGLISLTFNRNFLTKNSIYSYKELAVPYSGGFFMLNPIPTPGVGHRVLDMGWGALS